MVVGWQSCFPCFTPLVPDDHTELSREELKALFKRSLAVNNNRLIVHGIFARADTRNNNKRVYPKHILKREVLKYEKEHIVKGTALGELDHPNYASRYFKCLNLPNVSHQVLEVSWEGDQLWGSIEVLPSPSGLLLWELYSQGIKLGVSSRGWASLRSDPKQKCVFVDEDFELITFDFVTEPSTRGAYLVPIQKPYRSALPDQSKRVQITHLGYGVVSMRNIGRLPEPRLLFERIRELQAQPATVLHSSALQLPAGAATIGEGYSGQDVAPSEGRAHGLDRLLLYSHYLVHHDATYLHKEQSARDFRTHLAMFATRAHMADQQPLQPNSKGGTQLSNAVLLEIARSGGVADVVPVLAAPPRVAAVAAAKYDGSNSYNGLAVAAPAPKDTSRHRSTMHAIGGNSGGDTEPGSDDTLDSPSRPYIFNNTTHMDGTSGVSSLGTWVTLQHPHSPLAVATTITTTTMTTTTTVSSLATRGSPGVDPAVAAANVLADSAAGARLVTALGGPSQSLPVTPASHVSHASTASSVNYSPVRRNSRSMQRTGSSQLQLDASAMAERDEAPALASASPHSAQSGHHRHPTVAQHVLPQQQHQQHSPQQQQQQRQSLLPPPPPLQANQWQQERQQQPQQQLKRRHSPSTAVTVLHSPSMGRCSSAEGALPAVIEQRQPGAANPRNRSRASSWSSVVPEGGWQNGGRLEAETLGAPTMHVPSGILTSPATIAVGFSGGASPQAEGCCSRDTAREGGHCISAGGDALHVTTGRCGNAWQHGSMPEPWNSYSSGSNQLPPAPNYAHMGAISAAHRRSPFAALPTASIPGQSTWTTSCGACLSAAASSSSCSVDSSRCVNTVDSSAVCVQLQQRHVVDGGRLPDEVWKIQSTMAAHRAKVEAWRLAEQTTELGFDAASLQGDHGPSCVSADLVHSPACLQPPLRTQWLRQWALRLRQDHPIAAGSNALQETMLEEPG